LLSPQGSRNGFFLHQTSSNTALSKLRSTGKGYGARA
jgi:hypothetical protein